MRFSTRTDADAKANRITEEILRLRAAGCPVVDLTQSNPTEAGFTYPAREILSALSQEQVLRYEPAAKGIAQARTAVATYLNGKVDVDRIVLTSSTSEAYSYLFKLLCDPGDSILAPRPSYPLIDVLANLELVTVKQYALRYDYGWHIDFDSLESAIREGRARAVLYVNPNNPTGSYLSVDDYSRLLDICREHQLALICDEVFSDYAFGADPDRVATTAGSDEVLTFALSGLSKVCALPQTKLAWIAASGPAPALDAATERLEWIADSYLSPGAPVQWAAATPLGIRHSIQDQIRARTRRNLTQLLRGMENSSLNVLKVEGGWYATVQVPRIRSEEEWALELLRRYAVLVQPGYFYDFEAEAYLVLSLLTEADVFDRGLAALLDLAGDRNDLS